MSISEQTRAPLQEADVIPRTVTVPRRRWRLSWPLTVLAFAVVAAFAFPYVYMVLSAFKTPIDNITLPPKFIFDPTLDSFRNVFGNADLMRFLRNSVVVGSLSTAVAMLLAVPAAYGLVRFPRFSRTERLAYLFLIMQLLPPIAVVFPFFAIGDGLGLLDTPWILVITYTYWNVAWGIWLVRGFIQAVPIELEEAAMVDGCSRLQAIRLITLPLAAKGLSAAAILLFIGAWNEFTLAFFLTARHARTYPTSIGFFLTHAGVQWGEMFATAFIGTFPVVVFALMVRKTFISSMSFGAVKG
jgi:multiple sugar transport system permease protein